MKCPKCGDRKSIDIDIHSSGFTAEHSPVKECGACGLVWSVKIVNGKPQVDIIKEPSKKP